MSLDWGDYAFIYGGLLVTLAVTGLGTFIIIKLDERPSKSRK